MSTERTTPSGKAYSDCYTTELQSECYRLRNVIDDLADAAIGNARQRTADTVPTTASAIPRVNLNGACHDVLVNERREVCDALRIALQALRAAAPHGRDYQTAPAGSYELARALYETRCKQLEDMCNAITLEAMAIQDQPSNG